MAMRLTQAVRNITKFAPQLCCRAATRHVSSRMLCSLSSVTTRQQQYQQQSILQQAAALNTQQQRHMGGGPPHLDFHADLDESTLNVFRLYDKVDPANLTLEARLVEDLGLDSLDIVECVMAFEDEFSIFITDLQAESITTVQECADLVKKCLDEQY